MICPICGESEFAQFADRPAARCTSCGALERHRALVNLHEPLLIAGDGLVAL